MSQYGEYVRLKLQINKLIKDKEKGLFKNHITKLQIYDFNGCAMKDSFDYINFIEETENVIEQDNGTRETMLENMVDKIIKNIEIKLKSMKEEVLKEAQEIINEIHKEKFEKI